MRYFLIFNKKYIFFKAYVCKFALIYKFYNQIYKKLFFNINIKISTSVPYSFSDTFYICSEFMTPTMASLELENVKDENLF